MIYTQYEFVVMRPDCIDTKSIVIDYQDRQHHVTEDQKQSHFYEWIRGITDAFNSAGWILRDVWRNDGYQFQLMKEDQYWLE